MSADLNMNNYTTINFNISMIEFLDDLLRNNSNMTESENHTFQNHFSSECGSFPDLEKLGVRCQINNKIPHIYS